MAIQYNINTVGTLTNNDGVLSGFSSGNYATIPNGVDLGDDFEVVFKIKLTQIPDSGTWQGIFAGESGNYFQLSIGDSGKIGLDYGDGGSWDGSLETTTILTTNTDYYIKITYNGTAYKLLLSTDGTTYTEESSQNSSTIIPQFTGLIGSDRGLINFFGYGSVDLNGCYIKVNNTTVWEGVTNTTGVHIQLRRDTLSNWTSVNPTLYNGEVGLITDQAQYVVGDGSTTFTSLAKHNMDTNITNLADKDLSNLTATGEKHFLNKTQITNCILEAPNGTHTVSGSTITLKAGLKVLVPNGRNTDGTLNNTEYTIPSDTSFTYTYGIFIIKDNIWINISDNSVVRLQDEFTFYISYYDELASATGSNQYRIAYVRQDNKWYKTTDTGSTWVEESICPVGNVIVRADNTIGGAYINGTARIFTQSDRSEIAGLSAPSDYYISLTLGASGSRYTAPTDGWLAIHFASDNGNTYFNLYCNNNEYVLTLHSGNQTGFNQGGIVPMRKGTVVELRYDGSPTLFYFRFICAVGSEKEIR